MRGATELHLSMLILRPNKPPNEWLETVEINTHKIKCKIDTSAQCNVLPLSTYQKLIGTNGTLSQSKVKLIFSGHRTTPEGKITTLIQHKNILSSRIPNG